MIHTSDNFKARRMLKIVGASHAVRRDVAAWRRSVANAASEYVAMKFQGSRFRAIAIFLEPLLVLFLIVLVRSLFKQNLHLFGTSIVLFYASGVLPFYLFVFVSSRARAGNANALARLPGVSRLDQFFAITIVEVLIMSLMMTIVFAGIWLNDVDAAIPVSLLECMEALVLLVVLAMGVGLVNLIIAEFFRPWTLIYASATRGLAFLSGVFYLPTLMMPAVRDIVVWNPIFHGVEWFRVGLYGNYPAVLLDREYLGVSALCIFFLGLVLERASIRKRG
jgi:capsular polysaccharide transport system permease protein